MKTRRVRTKIEDRFRALAEGRIGVGCFLDLDITIEIDSEGRTLLSKNGDVHGFWPDGRFAYIQSKDMYIGPIPRIETKELATKDLT